MSSLKKFLVCLILAFNTSLFSSSPGLTYYDYTWIYLDGDLCYVYALFETSSSAEDEIIDILEIIKRK